MQLIVLTSWFGKIIHQLGWVLIRYPFFHYQPLDTPRVHTEAFQTSCPTIYTIEMLHALNTNRMRSLTRVRPSPSNWIGRIYITEFTLTLPRWCWNTSNSFSLCENISLFSLQFTFRLSSPCVLDEIPSAWLKLPRVTWQLKRMFYCILIKSH